jgi:hypothetical protein
MSVMDASDFFNNVVKPNYDEFVGSPTNIRSLWNVLVSMNTVPEFLALQQREYPPYISRNELHKLAEEIRGDLSGFLDLQFCADALKHIRKNFKDPGGGGATASSTGLLPDDQATWTIVGYDLVKVVHNAFATLRGIPELAPP